MGWSIGFDSTNNRDIGYGVPAYCDHPGCNNEIDRGMAYRCGLGENDDKGCGLFFCAEHLLIVSEFRGVQLCLRCYRYKPSFKPKPDHPAWVHHKLRDKSWAGWRSLHPVDVKAMRAALKQEVPHD